MGLGERIVAAIEARQQAKRRRLPGPHGDFHRNGGNDLLYHVPVTTGSLVIDAGGYKGDWTAGMLARYGCRSELFEPIPDHASHCHSLFSRNAMVRVHAAALGGSARTAVFRLAGTGSSEFSPAVGAVVVDAPVLDVASFLDDLVPEEVSCLKLNIEGGEYEVLERLLQTGHIERCRSLLIQFHRQPEGWARRCAEIEEGMRKTHVREWCYPMLWEKWVRRATHAD